MKTKLLLICVCVFILGCTSAENPIEKIASDTIQDTLHDPQSFELISVETLDLVEYLKKLEGVVKTDADARYNLQSLLHAHRKDPHHTLVEVNYRAKNGYGAIRVYENKVIIGKIESSKEAFGIILK